MTTRRRVLVSWSSGKDSAWTLHVLRQHPGCDVVGLLTTVSETFDRVSMHGVRRELLEAQAAATGLPLWPVAIPYPCPNEVYEARMADTLASARHAGVDAIAFGDLFLEDVRRYREERLRPLGVEPLFPLWGEPTPRLSRAMLDAGLRAIVTCVDPAQAPASLAGRPWDVASLASLPASADACGERGEFHTFVWDGPMFANPVPVVVGDIVERDGFVFADLLPGDHA